ncbi:hypothetical protein CPB86DRAFT_781149, partial [Serendipita vermifera]
MPLNQIRLPQFLPLALFLDLSRSNSDKTTSRFRVWYISQLGLTSCILAVQHYLVKRVGRGF